MRIFFLAVWLIAGLTQISAFGQTMYPVNPNQDILHYTFNITINDSTDEITGLATIQFTLKDTNKLILDLTNKGEKDKGMEVENVSIAGNNLSYEHENDRLTINIDTQSDNPAEINISYKGVPKRGLIIGDNKFGDRVFFGDNYPDRARNWLPCVDHPSDKATVTWIVSAPEHYKVVASGMPISESPTKDGYITTTSGTKVPISTKVMVFGAADFSVDQAGIMNNIPVTTWVYQKNEKEGFIDYAIAPKVLAYFDSLIAPYPYEKLANVQSRTTYGGMENAGNIFYYENSVTGEKKLESLIAHEIVHQWFGNSATELDWPHAWLSEGFATYLTQVYLGSRQGQSKMKDGLAKDREQVLSYWEKNPLPIVNYNLVTYPKISSLGELLSTNTYQKGGWVLHMLHYELGDEDFWTSVRRYYTKYKNSVASTADLQRVFEEVSGKKLQKFFQQWIYGMGQPVLAGAWSYQNKKLQILIQQKQAKPFEFPLELGLVYGDEMNIEKLSITSSMQIISLEGKEPDRIIIDPNVHLLYDGSEDLVKVDASSNSLNPNLLNDIWVLTQINGELIEGTKAPVMELHLKDKKLIGNGGCNNYNGSFEITGNRIEFDERIASTRMLCDNSSIEDAYLKTLTGNKFNYEISNNQLFLLQEGNSVLIFNKID